MFQAQPAPDAARGPTTKITDIRSLCNAAILAHRQSLAAMSARALELAAAGAPALAALPAATLVHSPPVEPSRRSSADTPPLHSAPRDRAECAMCVLERLAWIRHELNRAEQALHFREQQPFEALSETEAWLLRLRRGRSQRGTSPRTTPTSSPALAPAAPRTPPSRPTVVHVPEDVGQGLEVASAADAAVLTTRTPPPRRHSTGDSLVSGTYPRRHTRRPSSVNLPEFASITSTSTEVSVDAMPRAARAGRPLVHAHRRVTSSKHDKNNDDDDDDDVDTGAEDEDAHSSRAGESGDEDEDDEGAPAAARPGWLVRTEEIARDARPSRSPSGRPLRRDTAELLPSDSSNIAAPPGTGGTGGTGGTAGDTSPAGRADLYQGNPLQRDRSESTADTQDPTVIIHSVTSSAETASSPSGGRVPPLPGGHAGEFVVSVGVSPTDGVPHAVFPSTHPPPPSSHERVGVPVGHSTSTIASDAPPALSRANAATAAGAGPQGAGAVRVLTNVSHLHRTPSALVLPYAGAEAPSGPVLSVFERRCIRRLLGGVAMDIASVAILMDELGDMGASGDPATALAAASAEAARRTAEINPHRTAAARPRKTLRKRSERGEKRHAEKTKASAAAKDGGQTPLSVQLTLEPAAHADRGTHSPTAPPATASVHVGHMIFPTLTHIVPPPPPASGEPGREPTRGPGSASRTHTSPSTTGSSAAPSGPLAVASTESSASVSAATGSIMCRSPRAAGRCLPVPSSTSGGSTGLAVNTPIQAPFSTTTSLTGVTGPTAAAATHANNGTSNILRVPSAISFLDPVAHAPVENANRAHGSGPRNRSRHSRTNSSEDGAVEAVPTRHEEGHAHPSAPTPSRGSPDHQGLPRSPSPSHTRIPSQPVPPPPPHFYARDTGMLMDGFSAFGPLVSSPLSAGASRRSLAGSGVVDDPTGSFASRYDHTDGLPSAVAFATSQNQLSASNLMFSSTRLTSPTGSPSTVLRSGSERGGGAMAGGGGGGAAGGSDSGVASSRPMSRTTSMIRRPRKLDVATSNTKEIAPLVHHYRVISQGGASTHSAMSAIGPGGNNGLTSVQPSNSSFRGSGGGAGVAAGMFRTPSLDFLTEDSEMVNLQSPVAQVGSGPQPVPHRPAASPTTTSLLGSPHVEGGVGHSGARGQAGLHAVATTTSSTAALASGASGSLSAVSGTPAWSVTGAGLPSTHPSGPSSCESSQAQACISPPQLPGLRGTTSSFYAKRALTPNLPPSVAPPTNSAGHTHHYPSNRSNAHHHCFYSAESTESARQASGPFRLQDGGSLRSRSGCASPLSTSEREGDGLAAGRVASGTSLSAGAGSSEGYVDPRSGSPCPTERSGQSGRSQMSQMSLERAPSSDLSREQALPKFPARETPEGPSSPPPAMATVAPHAARANAFADSFLGNENSFSDPHRRPSPSGEPSPPTHAMLAPAAAGASALLTTLRPGEVHGGNAAPPVHATSDGDSPRCTTYEIDVDQFAEFLRCLFVVESMDCTEEELEAAELVYCIPGVREVPVTGNAEEETPSLELPRAGDEDGTDSIAQTNWLLPVVPGSGLERVHAHDFKHYVALVKRKIRDIETATGRQLLAH